MDTYKEERHSRQRTLGMPQLHEIVTWKDGCPVGEGSGEGGQRGHQVSIVRDFGC